MGAIPAAERDPPVSERADVSRTRCSRSVRGAVIDVVVADAQPLFRDALVRVIRQDAELRLAAETADGRAALAAIEARRPAVALLARELMRLDGDGVLAAVARSRLPTRIVLLEPRPGPDVWTLLGAGAAGLLSRRVTADAVRSAVHRVAGGGTALCPEAQAAVAREVRARRCERPLLSPREQQVLELVADGLSAPRIAQRLQLGTATVRTHLQHLCEKLEAADRAQLVRHAMRRKLLD
jgi:two-component system, NarL family, nitrate/nitrite response regulator NarL